MRYWQHRRRLYNRRSELAAATVGTDSYGYAYDSIGNRLWSAANAVTNSYTANSLNQYTAISAKANPVYDADGNMTGDGTFAYAYDAENRLVSVTSAAETNGAIRVLNAYDHRNRRIRKTVQRLNSSIAPPPSPPVGIHEWETQETHTFVWDGNNIVLEKVEFADGTTRTFEYFWGADKSGAEQGAGGVEGLLAVSMDGVFYIPCYDHNGNIILYVSETGSIAAQYTYDPYGNIVDSSGNLADVFSFGFSTQYHDRETGMVGYKRRFYRPDLGRWLNRDPIEEEGGENLYAFCANNPVLYYDILGMTDWMTVLRGAIQIVSGTMLAITAGSSVVGSGGLSTPAAIALTAWASASIASGIQTLSAGLNDRGSPEAIQVQAVEYAYESIMGDPMGETGRTITRICYYSIDIACSCYSISYTWSSYFQSRSVFIPKYGSEIKLTTPSGITVEKATSEMRFIGTKIGLGAQGTSMTIDFYSIFSDTYEIFNDGQNDSINPDVDRGGR